jgi:glycosyltransferase involved in cell wall biosynthesis
VIDPENPNFALTPASDGLALFDYAPAIPTADVEPWVTIVTPFFNTGPEFHETGKSVLRQSLQQWEWVIVNDASTSPESLKVLDAWRHMDSRIRIVDHAQNRGPGAARNTGFEAARAAFVLQLDSDNLLEPTAAEKWCWYLETHPEAAFVKGLTVGFGGQQYLWARGFHEGPVFVHANLVDATSMVRRSVHTAVGGYDEHIRGGFEDWNFWLRCANAGYWGGTVREYHDWFRRRADHSDRWPDWDNGARERTVRERFRKQFPSLTPASFPVIPVDARPHNPVLIESLPYDNLLKKEKRRVLLVIPWLAMGGSDRFNLDFLDEITKRGWEVTVATTLISDDEWLPQYSSRTPDVFALHRFIPVADYPRFLHYLIRSRQIDTVLITHSELGYRLLPYLRSHCANVAFLDYVHVVEPVWNQGGYPRFSVEYREQLDLSVSSSESVRSWMIDRGADPAAVEVCYTGVDTTKFIPDIDTGRRVRSELGAPDDAVVVLFAGRLCKQKQPKLLIDSLLEFLERVPTAVAWIVGDGPDRSIVESAMSGNASANRIQLLGAVPPDSIGRLMSGADLLFLPSQYEGIALVLFEAMASGLPVIASDVGGQNELVTDDCGVLVRLSKAEFDKEQFVDALVDLASDPERRRQLGEEARARVSRYFSLEEMGRRMADLISQAERLHSASPRVSPPPGLALASATSAVELTRLADLSAYLWKEQRGHNSGQWMYIFLNRWLSPVYDWTVSRGWNWPVVVGNRIRRALLGHD